MLLFKWAVWLLLCMFHFRSVCVDDLNYNDPKPEDDYSCFIRQKQENDVFVICPTQVKCMLRAYRINTTFSSSMSFVAHLKGPCQTKNKASLPAGKIMQLQAVFRVLGLSQEPECEFSSIEVLELQYVKLVNMGQLGRRGNCPPRMDEECEEQLEHLKLTWCQLGSIEAQAFTCLSNLRQLYLNRNRLTHLLDDLFRNNPNLQHVDLNFNNLIGYTLKAHNNKTSLEQDGSLTFSPNLISLDLGYNNLSSLRSGFVHAANLTTLGLPNNSISHVNENAFYHLTSVTSIDLRFNNIAHLHRNTFRNNLQLVELVVNNNKLTRVPPVAHLSRLQHLFVRYNVIEHVNKSDFINCSMLREINLSDNRLSWIQDGSFDNATHIEMMNLNRNQLSELTANFQNSNISKLYLKYNNYSSFSFHYLPREAFQVELSFNQIDTIEPFNFSIEIGSKWKLVELDLSNNSMESIDSLRLPPSIKIIDLSNNKINRVLSGEDLSAQNLKRLSSIDLRGNNITTICASSFTHFPSIIYVQYYVSGNPLECSLENNWMKSSANNRFIFSDLSDIYCRDLQTKDKVFLLSTLQDKFFMCVSGEWTASRQKCAPYAKKKCAPLCFPNCTCLTNFYYRVYVKCHNNARLVLSDLKYHSKYYVLYYLDLSNSSISHLAPIDFGYITTRVPQLLLSNCDIRSLEDHAFDLLANLSELNLSHNQLTELPHQIFRNLTRLVHLDLSNNRLIYLDDHVFIPLIKLQTLHLHSNNLNVISVNQMKNLGEIMNISLVDNPWSCSCEFIELFRTFLIDWNKIIDKIPQINCVKNEQHINIAKFNMKVCVSQVHRTALIVSLAFALVFIAAFALVFKWRYEIQVLLYSRHGLRMLHRTQPEDDSDKQYDAFIAYNSEDDQFLVHDLMPGLEGIDNPYRLCIHERDFPAGSYIQDSILDAIKMSSRTIVILSENFVKSGWCRYEFKSAHMQMLQDRCPRLLVILLGEVPETLDPEMQLYLKTNTYLRWGERLFWQKLYYAMPELRVTSPPTDIMPMRNF